jgi:putative tryptophan/tyrosine transport system substrate-binding protein
MQFSQLNRRELVTLLGGAAAAWPLVARAQQQSGRLRRMAVLSGFAVDDPEGQARIAAFRQGMQEQGWTEDRNVQIDYRWAGPDAARIKAFAAELVGTSPTVILALTSPSVAALREVTHTIPVVFVGIGDPVGQGFVASLARPGGNITGFTGFEFSLGEKWLGLLKELAPGISRAAFLFHPELGPYHLSWFKSVEAAATALGVQMTAAPTRAAGDVEAAISTIAVGAEGGLVVEPDAYTVANRRVIIDFAARYRVPAVYGNLRDAVDGGLVSYGPDVNDLFRRSASYIDRILKGEQPADLPVQQPLKYELVINVKTANALGLTVPDKLLATADEVIE